MSFLTYIIGAFALVCLGALAGWFIAQCVAEMDNDGMDRRESEHGDIFGGKK